MLFRSNDTATTEIYTSSHTLPLHDALPISTPVASISPETDARASTTRRLQPLSASLVLWRKPRNPPFVAACAPDPGVDATAATRSELRSRLPFTAVHRTVHRPQHLHVSSPSTLDACIPATKDQAHDHTARLTIHSSQPGEGTQHSTSSLFRPAQSLPALFNLIVLGFI